MNYKVPSRCRSCDGDVRHLNRSDKYLCLWCEAEYSPEGEIIMEHKTAAGHKKSDSKDKAGS